MRGILGFLRRFSQDGSDPGRHLARGHRLALETLESRLTPSAATDLQVTNLYRTLLERKPEAPALAAWSGALESGRITVGQMAEQVLHSPEYTNRVVTGSYQWYLDRVPDTAGQAAQSGALQRGVSHERVDAGILGSAEYFTKQGSTNPGFVQGLYRDVLGREPDSAGLQAHLASLARGVSRTDLAFCFLICAELGTQVAGTTYQQVLGRDGSQQELDYWAGVLAQTAKLPSGGVTAVLAGVAGSPEGASSLARPMTLVGLPVGSVPAAVQDLKAKPVDIGTVRLTWSASPGATSYTIRVDDGRKEIRLEKGTEWDVANLGPTRRYTFTVVPNNAAGSGPETKVEFGATSVGLENTTKEGPITIANGSIWVGLNLESKPTLQRLVNQGGVWEKHEKIELKDENSKWLDGPITGLTTGIDGSIWAALGYDTGNVVQVVQDKKDEIWKAMAPIRVKTGTSGLTTDKDGNIWVASDYRNTVQRIAKVDQKWEVQEPAISVNQAPSALAADTFGNIWVASSFEGTVQRIANEMGTWAVRGAAIPVGDYPWALAAGTDGSIWVANKESNSIQRIAQEGGSWSARGAAIQVDDRPYMTLGLDGSVWVGSSYLNTYQQIVNEGGRWLVKGSALKADQMGGPRGMVTGPDGSVYVYTNNDLVRQIWTNPTPPVELVGSYDRALGRVTLTGKAPKADGGTPVCYYTATAWQGSTSQTMRTVASSFTFSGLAPGKGPVYFTVTATNFAGTSPVATLLLGTDGQPIDTRYRSTGITTDGLPVIGNGLDGLGNTYSWEALVSGKFDKGNVSFDLGSPNQPGVTRMAGQTIHVPPGNYRTINLAATAVNGARKDRVFRLTYTDETSDTWKQSFSDWAAPQNFAGETKILTMEYRNRGDGTKDQRPVHLYGYSRAVPAGKTLRSITLLETDPKVQILAIQMGK